MTVFDAFLAISEDLSLNFLLGSMPPDPLSCLPFALAPLPPLQNQ